MSDSAEQAADALINQDPWLEPYREGLIGRYSRYAHLRELLMSSTQNPEADVSLFSAYNYFGLNVGSRFGEPGYWVREWAPGATYLSLIGDFNGWDRGSHPMERDIWGVWSLFLPHAEYADRLVHGSAYKVHVGHAGGGEDRIPAYARRVVQMPDTSFTAQFWSPPEDYAWQNPIPPTPPDEGLRIYEAHVGMAQEEPRVGTYLEFADNILPRIASLGYNAIQLMAVMEHPYYGSFGYHVSSFYAACSRFGTPEELKELVDRAHGYGIRVIMDLVHSHAVKNRQEGLAGFDGTDHQYFHAGPRGVHPAWDSQLFDYSKYEVLRFLLSNVRYWLEEFRFDGYRFDGVTSMLYLDHGLGRTFQGYADYFNESVDLDAAGYLMLANEVAHAVRPGIVTVAEDVSGMPGMARPIEEAGLGFDYRLSMGIPDFWIKNIKERRDEDWDIGAIYHELTNRRSGEPHVGYAESHDQALVGDQTLAFRLMGPHIYTGMSVFSQDPIVSRGVALHKIIRLLTFTLGGEGYLNFMGNEFGHPEWIDFPREGNGYSHHYARRQWSLADTDHLRYRGLERFDRALQGLDSQYHILCAGHAELLAVHQDTLQLVYRRGELLVAVNLHPQVSYPDLRIPAAEAADYEVILSTDAAIYGGTDALQEGTRYPWQPVPMYGKDQSIQIYLPARSAQVLRSIRRAE
jgi:1,4-alpha-glucan branching enzyme